MTAAKREKLALLVALAGVVTICWWYLVDLSQDMSPLHETMTMGPWSPQDWLMMLGMWVVMMTAMMVPTAIRAVLIFERIGEQARRRGRLHPSAHWFAAGYIATWSLFGVGATTLQWALDQAALLSPMMVANSWYLGTTLLMLAGIWQLSPWKRSCLQHCQSPAMFIARNFRAGRLGAIRIGMAHGLYCVGCCWAIMGLLFLGGLMNFAWIALITIFVLAEKLLPPALGFSRVAGWLMIIIGIGFLLFGAINNPT